MKTSVLYIITDDLWAGAEVVSFHLLSRLAKEPELELCVLTFNEGQLTRGLREQGVPVITVPEADRTFWQMLRRARRALRGRGFAVVHTQRLKEHALALLLFLWRWKAPRRVATIHGLPEALDGGRDRRLVHRLKLRINELILRRLYQRVVAVSRDIERQLRGAGYAEAQVIQIHNGIPLAENGAPSAPAPAAGADRELVVGTVGRLVPVKGYDRFLQVAARVAAELPNVVFRLLGDGPLRDELEALRGRLGLAGRVELLPAVADPARFYSSLDLYLNTSRHEGIPLSVLEAMAHARAVVAPRVGGIPEIIDDGVEGRLVGGDDPADFARACVDYLRDPGLRERAGRMGRERVARSFSADHMARAYKRLYLELSRAASGRETAVELQAPPAQDPSRGRLRPCR